MQMQPEQAHFLLHGAFLPSLQGEHRVTKSVIAAMPADQGDYKPNAYSRPAMELAWHIVATEKRFLGAIGSGAFDLAPFPKPEEIKNSQDLAAWYGEHFPQWLEPLSNLTGEQLVKIIDFRGVFQLPAVMYCGFTLHHTVHHRGQLSVYIRPMGGKVPAMYGESYDSAEARKAAQTPVA